MWGSMSMNRVTRYVLPGAAVVLMFAAREVRARVHPEQAAAGRATYEQSCVTCHGPNLRQLPGAVLAGPEFVAKWGERGTSELLVQARATMPPDRPGALSEETYLGLIAYLLQSNGGAANAEPLTVAGSAPSAPASTRGSQPRKQRPPRPHPHRRPAARRRPAPRASSSPAP